VSAFQQKPTEGLHQDDELTDAELESAFRLVHFFTHRKTAITGTLWEDGKAPTTSPAIVLGDGLGSRSTPIFTFGVEKWAREDHPGTISCLLLLQPALMIAPRVAEAWENFPRYTLSGGLLADLAPEQSTDFQTRLIEALRTISQTIPTRNLFWPGDRFLTYPPALMDRIAVTGVAVEPLEYVTFPPDMKDIFQRHCHVARDESVLGYLAQLAHQCLP
jgi:hypothetical protein